MTDFEHDDIRTINIEDEMRQSYVDYAMSVIVGRALPDVRDGLKPVHRRVLFAMSEQNNAYNRPYMKSARIVGDVIGKYHPHGDTASYYTIVRMAQPFSYRYPLVDGQGNWGSSDDPKSFAAMRYTESKLSKYAEVLLSELAQGTVDWRPNFDATMDEPEILPARVPNVLLNGTTGIAVGMATDIPPHNLVEVINGTIALIDDATLEVDGLMAHILGPDFPTAAIINGRAGIVQAYRTGHGRVVMRARCEIILDEKTGKSTIIVHEIPYQVNKSKLIEKIAELHKEKKVEGITDLRDESAKETRLVIELRRDVVPEVVLNNLYAQTQLQSVFGINLVALVDNQPRVLNLKQVLEYFIVHRREVVTRRTVYLLRRAAPGAMCWRGGDCAFEYRSNDRTDKNECRCQEAREKLLARAWASETVTQMLERAGPDAAKPDDLGPQYGLKADGLYFLSPEQAQAILEMRLNRLTGLEQEKLLEEYREIIDNIADLMEILMLPERLMTLIKDELIQIRDEYGDERRSEIVESQEDLNMEDLITPQDMVVTLSNGGYAKTQPLSDYQAQRRGGRGRSASAVKEEDFIEKLLVTNSHDTLLCFSDRGKVYWLRTFQIPIASRAARGRPIINILPLTEGERITAILPIEGYNEDQFILMATANGTVKKTPLMDFARPRSSV